MIIKKPIYFSLDQNYPNPFNPATIIKYALQKRTRVKIIVYDITGKKIKTLIDKNQNAGKYSITFNAGDLASGIYIYTLKTNTFLQSRKMILIK